MWKCLSASLWLGLAILSAACGEPATRAPDIVLVVLDTVRRDHLSTYGYERETSPRLSELAAESRLYSNAYATGGWTVPSHASVFTGLYPVGHGATQEQQVLAAGFETLAEILRAQGYQTVAVTGNAMITARRGFDQGFEIYHQSWMGARKQDRDLISLAWLEDFLSDRADERPLFLFVNLIGAHTPFDSCGEHCGAFEAEPSGGPVDSHWRSYYRGRRDFSPGDFDRLTRLYDAEILQVDAILGRMLALVDRELPMDSTFVAVTSDHGENIGDHGHVNHVFSVHESTIQVPLVVRYPPLVAPGSEESRPAQLLDLFPTILGVAGVAVDANAQQGLDLITGLDPGRPILSEYYRPDQAMASMLDDATPAVTKRLLPHRRRIRSVIEDDWKFIWGSDGRHELYHLRTDPDEERNLIADESTADRRRSLEATLEAMLERYRGAGGVSGTQAGSDRLEPLDAETRAELRRLGYID